MPLRKSAILFLIFFVGLGLSCKTTEIHEVYSGKEGYQLVNKNEVQKKYSPYKYLNADFQLKGNVNGDLFTYMGKLRLDQSDNPPTYKLVLVVRDLVFMAPLVTISIDNDKLTWIDHINNKEKNFTYSNSSIIFFSNQQLPTEILIPLITGYLPDALLSQGKGINGKAGIKYSNREYEAMGFFKESILETLIYNPAENYNQVVYQISGSAKNSIGRYFPGSVKILLAEKDFIEITYNRVDLK